MIYNPSNKQVFEKIQQQPNYLSTLGPLGYVDFDDVEAKQQISKIEDNPFGIFSINRTNKIYYNPLEDVDLEEKKAILYDIFNSMPVQGDLKITDADF